MPWGINVLAAPSERKLNAVEDCRHDHGSSICHLNYSKMLDADNDVAADAAAAAAADNDDERQRRRKKRMLIGLDSSMGLYIHEPSRHVCTTPPCYSLSFFLLSGVATDKRYYTPSLHMWTLGTAS
jgi:hypothetical protein